MFNRDVPPKGQRPTIGRKTTNHTTALPEDIVAYIKKTIKEGESLYGALYDAYDNFYVRGEIGDWIARNEDTFAKEWLKEKGVI